jgi:hypothetical protein
LSRMNKPKNVGEDEVMVEENWMPETIVSLKDLGLNAFCYII